MELSMELITNLVTLIISIAVLIIFIYVAYRIFIIPIGIAENRNLSGNDLTLIKILTWCGLITGVSWFIALLLSLLYSSNSK